MAYWGESERHHGEVCISGIIEPQLIFARTTPKRYASFLKPPHGDSLVLQTMQGDESIMPELQVDRVTFLLENFLRTQEQWKGEVLFSLQDVRKGQDRASCNTPKTSYPES